MDSFALTLSVLLSSAELGALHRCSVGPLTPSESFCLPADLRVMVPFNFDAREHPVVFTICGRTAVGNGDASEHGHYTAHSPSGD